MAEMKSNVFAQRNFQLVFFGALVSELGAVLYSFAVSFYILEISDNNAFLQGLYLACCGVVLLLSTPIGGVLGDRWNKAHIMFVCDYLRGGVICIASVMLLLLPNRSAQIAILFVSGILGSVIGGIFSPAAASLLPHIVQEEQFQQANAYFTIRSSLQSIFGIVLAGVLYAAMPVYALFLIVGMCYVLSGVSEMFIRYAHSAPKEKLTVRFVLQDMGDGLRYLRSKPAILSLMGAILFINFFFTPVQSNFLPYFIKTDVAAFSDYLLHGILTPEMWSSVFSVFMGITSLTAAALLSARPQAEKCGRATAIRLCAMAAVMLVATVLYWLLVAMQVSLNGFLIVMCVTVALLGYIVVSINIPINTTIMRVVQTDMLSKVNSAISILSQGLVPISSVVGGAILQYFGSTILLSACTLGFVVTALCLLFNKRTAEI